MRPIGAGEAARRRERDGRCRGARAGAARVGDAGNGERRILRLERARAKLGGIGLARDRRASRNGQLAALQQLGGRKAGIGILGRFARHRQAALDQRRQRFVRQVGRGDGRRALADEQAQADLLAFGAADALELAEAHLHARRALADIERVGGVAPAAMPRSTRDSAIWRACSGDCMARAPSALERPTTSIARKTSSPQVRFERNSRSASSPSLGSARSAWLARCSAAGTSASKREPVRPHRPDRRAPQEQARARRRCAMPSGALSPSRRAEDLTPTSASSSMSWIA